MSLNAEKVQHDRGSILGRMRTEVTAIAEQATKVWQTCLSQGGQAGQSDRPLILTGCGDSYYAGLAVRHRLEMMLRRPVVVWPAMEVTAYPSRALEGADMVAVSVSGKVGRTIDAVEAHRGRGGRTIAVTAHADSDLANAADAAVATGVRGTPGPVPGTANYVASMLGLLALGAASASDNRWRDQVSAALSELPDVLAQASRFCSAAVEDVTAPIFVVGSGPDFGTANFAVAKLLEAAATVGVAQDLEEWAHEQYFVTDAGRTVIVFGHDACSVPGARRVIDMVKAIGARSVSIGNDVEALEPDALGLPPVDPGLSPLLTWVPAALFALELANRYDRHPFGIDTPGRMETVDRNIYIPSPARA